MPWPTGQASSPSRFICWRATLSRQRPAWPTSTTKRSILVSTPTAPTTRLVRSATHTAGMSTRRWCGSTTLLDGGNYDVAYAESSVRIRGGPVHDPDFPRAADGNGRHHVYGQQGNAAGHRQYDCAQP